MVDTCIIPAAGKGTRWAPTSSYIPKEMLPLVNEPVIRNVIEMIVKSGCAHAIVVLSRQKEMIRKFLNDDKILTKTKISYIYQDEPFGIAHCIWLCRKLIGDSPFGVTLPDLPTISRVPVMKQLINAFNELGGNSHVVSFDKFPDDKLYLYGECSLTPLKNNLLQINHFCAKQADPKKPHHPNNVKRMSGNFVFTPEIIPIIKKLLDLRVSGEVSDRSALRSAQESSQTVVGLKIEGHTYDTGYPEGYTTARQKFALTGNVA